ncbi:MAG: FAD-dependent oxidoreductase [Bermanella sp.]
MDSYFFIASAFPNKDITLSHSGGVLLDNMKPKAQTKALEQLIENGVKVKFNRRFILNIESEEKSEGNEDGQYRCSNTIKADKVYTYVGMVPNTEFLRTEMAGVLDGKGLIKVDSFMKVKGYDNLYALGDCSDLDDHKHGYLASVQGGMLAKAKLKVSKGKKVKPYKTPPLAVITPTGTDSGVAQMPFGVFTANFFINLKQKDLGISNMYKMFGSEPDELGGVVK